MEKDKREKVIWFILFFALLLATIIVYTVDNSWSAQVLSACLGAFITIFATKLLLSSQNKSEKEIEKERRELEDKYNRDLKFYNAKLKVYSDFVYGMYDILSDNEVTKKEMLDLRKKLFGQVSFYVEGDILSSINKKLSDVKDYKDSEQMQSIFYEVASILQIDLRKDWPIKSNSAISLWETFNRLFRESENNIPVKKAVEDTHKDTESTIIENVPPSLTQTFWHFAMWGADEQLKALGDGVHELNLVEYSEDWRTNLLRQVEKDDLVFLFRSGGWGYMGVYRVLGWRVFELKNDGSETETINVFGEPTQVLTKEKDSQYKKDLERSDIYWIREPENREGENSYNFCSSIIVEPLAFASDGIGNPGGVYRRTISRYDYDYGLMQLSRFMAIMDDDKIYDVYYNGETKVRMGCNKESFKKILATGNIKPAERDKNGEWI